MRGSMLFLNWIYNNNFLSKCVKPVISIEQAMHSFLIIKSNDRRVWTLCFIYHWAKVLLTLFLSLRHAYKSRSTSGYKNVCSSDMKKPTGHSRLFEKRAKQKTPTGSFSNNFLAGRSGASVELLLFWRRQHICQRSHSFSIECNRRL